MKKYLTKKYIVWGAVGVVVVLVAIFIFKNGGNGAEVVTVAKKDIIQEVVVTGKTKADLQVDLGFDASGRVANSNSLVGQKVYRGQTVAELDISSELANLSKEKALLAEEEVKLGSEGERIESSIRKAYAVADNAVRNKTDQFFKTPSGNPFFEVKFTNGNFVHYFAVSSETAIDLNNERSSIEKLLVKWQSELAQLNSSNAKNFTATTIERMNSVSSFLDKVALAVNSFTPSEFAYDSTVVGYKTAVDSARSTVAAARENLINADTAGIPRVNQIKSSIQALEAGLGKSRIEAPFTGTITRQDAKVGQVAAAGQVLVSLISEDNMYVEANVSEVNIGKVKTGDKVRVEFDAYPGKTFSGTVRFIDPGESIVDKVVNYKIRVDLETRFPNLKSGLTANVKIATAMSHNALTVPVYATVKEGDKIFVTKLVGGKPVKTEVKIGLTGSDGSVEIISGLSEGDQINYTK